MDPAAPPHRLPDLDLLQALLAQLPGCVVALDLDGALRLQSEAAARTYGLVAGERPGLRSSSAPDEDLLAAALQGEPRPRGPGLLHTGRGAPVAVDCEVRPLRHEGLLVGLLLVLDPPGQEGSADHEREARRSAEEANRMKDEFLATVSHELRTPLNAVLGWASILRQRRADPRSWEKGLEAIERNAQVQAKLVEDLLDLGRIISGKLRVTLRPLDPVPALLAAAEVVRPMAEAKGVTLTVSVGPGGGPRVAADAERLQQVVWNLLVNAVKFTPSGGRVQLGAHASAHHLEIEVQDSGQGIPVAFMPYLFERFRQAEGGPVRTQAGLGLGLALVRHVVELHGGRVEAHSAGEGQGATFRVSLPLAPPPSSQGES